MIHRKSRGQFLFMAHLLFVQNGVGSQATKVVSSTSNQMELFGTLRIRRTNSVRGTQSTSNAYDLYPQVQRRRGVQ